MKNGAGFLAWSVAVVLFILSVYYFGAELPERVATHFDGAGHANGWMPRAVHLRFFTLFGIGSSVFVIVIGSCTRYLPASLLNVPHPEYWRSPEHYPEACAFFSRHLYWFATLLLLWSGVLHYLLVQANHRTPTVMDNNAFWILVPTMLVGLAVWTFTLVRFYYNVDKK